MPSSLLSSTTRPHTHIRVHRVQRPLHNPFFGGEITCKMELGLLAKGFARTILGFIRALQPEMHHRCVSSHVGWDGVLFGGRESRGEDGMDDTYTCRRWHGVPHAAAELNPSLYVAQHDTASATTPTCSCPTSVCRSSRWVGRVGQHPRLKTHKHRHDHARTAPLFLPTIRARTPILPLNTHHHTQTQAAETFVLTPPGENPPPMGQHFPASDNDKLRRAGRLPPPRFDAGCTVSFSFHSMFIDFQRYVCARSKRCCVDQTKLIMIMNGHGTASSSLHLFISLSNESMISYMKRIYTQRNEHIYIVFPNMKHTHTQMNESTAGA